MKTHALTRSKTPICIRRRLPHCGSSNTTTASATAITTTPHRLTSEVISIGPVYLLFARVLAWDSGSVVKTLSGAPTIWLSFIFSTTIPRRPHQLVLGEGGAEHMMMER